MELKQARTARLQQERATLALDLETLPLRKDLLAARIAAAEAGLAPLAASIAALKTRLSATRIGQATDAIDRAQAALDSLPTQAEALRSFARENLDLASARRVFALAEADQAQRTAQMVQRKNDIERSAETVERILGTGSLTDELGDVLRGLRAGLPKAYDLNQKILTLKQAQVALQLDQILWQERLRDFGNSAEVVERLTDSTQISLSSDTQSAIVPLLFSDRVDLLSGLIEDARREADHLATEEIATRELLAQTDPLARSLDRRLLWLRTSEPIDASWFATLPTGFAALTEPQKWTQALSSLMARFSGQLFGVFCALLLAVLLLLSDQRLHSQLSRLSKSVGNVGQDRYWTTPLAVLITFSVALPIPIILSLLGWGLAEDSGLNAFNQTLSQAFFATSFVVFILFLFREMARPEGLFDGHFGWSETAAKRLWRALTWFTFVQGGVTFVFTLASQSNEIASRYSVGLIAFIIGAVGIIVFVWKLFRPGNSVFSDLFVNHNLGRTAQTVLFPVLLLGPLINGILPLRGYFDTAIALQSKVFQSGIMLFSAAVIFGLLMRLYLVAQRRFALQKAREYRQKREALRVAASETEASGDAVPQDLDNSEPDPDLLSNQMRNVLLSIAGVFLAITLWRILDLSRFDSGLDRRLSTFKETGLWDMYTQKSSSARRFGWRRPAASRASRLRQIWGSGFRHWVSGFQRIGQRRQRTCHRPIC